MEAAPTLRGEVIDVAATSSETFLLSDGGEELGAHLKLFHGHC